MVINRYFCSTLGENEIILSEDEHHHLTKVCRQKKGEEVEVIDGKGHLFKAKIKEIQRHKTHLEIFSFSHTPPTRKFTLVQGLCRQNRLDLILEKGCEIGVDQFIIIPMDRSETHTLSENRLSRMHRILQCALKQSGRLHLPSLSILSTLHSIPNIEQVYFGDLSADALPFHPKIKETPLTFVVGPESGFSDEERLWLKTKGIGVRLNPNILRTETAAIVAAALYFGIQDQAALIEEGESLK
ncbi:MAG: RsmE family RNA methyltransferase [Simkaniaceae bacterium]